MPKDLTGTTLGKYQIIERLGRGGMAEVYRAFQPGMNRYVALKVLHGHLADNPDFIARFNREAQSAGSLRHPNIVQVIDFDVQDGEYYMVMEFIKGESLKAMLSQRGGLPIGEALLIAGKLADAVAYAHDMGVIHRDIKPANVLMPAPDNPILSDFGIARLTEVPGLTRTGVTVGTPEYMSPEAGMGESVDHRADIYSLGIVLYEMLTGQVPYGADTPFAVILKHIQDPLPMPSGLPLEVEQILLKALAKNRDDRYQTAAELRDAIAEARQHIPGAAVSGTGARPAPGTVSATRPPEAPTVTAEAGVPVGRRLPLPAIGGGLLVVLIVAIVVALASGNQGTQTAQLAVTPTAQTPEATATSAPSPTPELTATTASTPSPEPTATTAATREATAVAMSGGQAGKYAALIAEVKQMLVRGESGALERAANALKADPDSYDLKVLLARAKVEVGDDEQAAQGLTEGLEAIKSAPERPEAYIVPAIYESFRRTTEDNSEAIVAKLRAAIPYCDQAIKRNTDDYYAYALRAYANATINGYVGSGNNVPPQAIIDDLEKAVSFNPIDPRVYTSLSGAYADERRYTEALQAFLKLRVFYPDETWYYSELAERYFQAGEKRPAFELFADEIRKRPPVDPGFLADAAYIAWANNEMRSAADWANTALIIEPRMYPAVYVQGLVAGAQEDYAGALARLETIAKNAPNDYGSRFLNPSWDRELNLDRARVLAKLGRLDEAVEAATASVEQYGSWHQPYIERAKLYQAQGKIEEARQDLRAALNSIGSEGDPQVRDEIFALLAGLPTPTP